jgi:hypothetical protein
MADCRSPPRLTPSGFSSPRYPPRFVSRSLRLRSLKVGGCLPGRVIVQPATQLPACSHVGVNGIVPSVSGWLVPFGRLLRKSTKRVLSGWSMSPYRASRLPRTPRTCVARTCLVTTKTSAHYRSAKTNNIQGESYADIHDIDELYGPGNPHDQGCAETRERRPRPRQEVGH